MILLIGSCQGGRLLFIIMKSTAVWWLEPGPLVRNNWPELCYLSYGELMWQGEN